MLEKWVVEKKRGGGVARDEGRLMRREGRYPEPAKGADSGG